MDPARVRTYEQGGYTLGQIDADAHSRVVYGKCRTPFLQHEKTLATRFVRRAGALTGIGLARAARADHQLDPATPASFSTYSSRSGLEASTAKLGVLVANALPAAEEYWRGAVALVAPSGQGAGWLSAVAWMRDGRVTRVLVNVGDESKLGDLPASLAAVYGAPGTTTGAVTTWRLPGGATARLDIGAATSLVVENAAAASSPPASVGSSGPTAVGSASAMQPGATPPATPDMAPCCNALEQAMASASDAQRSGYVTLLGVCRMNNSMTVNSPSAARKAQLRQNAAVMNLPPLPAACQ